MFEWNYVVQEIIDLIERSVTETPSLIEISRRVGYSPYYCSAQFHRITGTTLRSYIAGRRLCHAALELRDTDARILDIAVKYGFSSQEAFTRAFVSAYGCSPHAYRRNPRPIPLSIRQVVVFPEHYCDRGGDTMSCKVTQANVRVEYIPAHQYIGVWDLNAQDYGSFWARHDCDEICGVIDSMSNVSDPVVTCHTAGWFYDGGRKGYFYGLGAPADYEGEIPEGFERRSFPASYYLVFFHPPFDYLKDNGEVMRVVEELAWNYDPREKGWEWNERANQDYQRHYPEVLGYEVLRPVRRP